MRRERGRERQMSQGAVLELDDLVRAELRRLKQRKPDQNRHVEQRLRGFQEDLEDYWIEISCGEQTWQVTTADGWTGVKHAIETTSERLRDTRPVELTAPQAPPPKRPAKPATSRKKKPALDEDDFSWLPRAKLTGRRLRQSLASLSQVWRPGAPKNIAKLQGRSRAATAGNPLPGTPRESTQLPSPVTMPPVSARALIIEKPMGPSTATKLPTSLNATPLTPEIMRWRQSARPMMLASIQAAVAAWLRRKAPEGRAAWTLQHITTPRPPNDRPSWAGDLDNYLVLTHLPSGSRWEMDLLEQWFALEPRLASSATVSQTGLPSRAATSAAARRLSTPPTVPPSLPARPGYVTVGDQALVPCPQFHTVVRRDRLVRHQTRCPARKDNTPAPVRAETRVVADPTRKATLPAPGHGTDTARDGAPGKKKASPEDLGYADPRDASKGWGHHFRDHGRFGSFPVHDGYGDEAEP